MDILNRNGITLNNLDILNDILVSTALDLANSIPELSLKEAYVAKINAIKQEKLPQTEYRERFLLKQGSRLVPISVENIAYFYSQERLTFVKTWDERSYVVDYTLDELECILHPKHFFRANRQVILCVKAVDKVHLHFNSRLKLDLKPATTEEVFISRDKSGEFRLWMGE